MLDDPAVVQDIVRRLRLLNPEPRPKYNPVPSKLRAPARAKEWWKKHPERRKEVVAKYEGSHPEAKQTRKARYRSRLKNAVGAFTRLQWEESSVRQSLCVLWSQEQAPYTRPLCPPLKGRNESDRQYHPCMPRL